MATILDLNDEDLYERWFWELTQDERPVNEILVASLEREARSRGFEMRTVLGALGLTAAKVWDPDLHPRGHDGRFIELLGFINLLNFKTGDKKTGKTYDMSGQRGQVVGITPDPKNPGKPTIRVRLDDPKTGKPRAIVNVKPENIEQAPEQKAQLDESMLKVGDSVSVDQLDGGPPKQGVLLDPFSDLAVSHGEAVGDEVYVQYDDGEVATVAPQHVKPAGEASPASVHQQWQDAYDELQANKKAQEALGQKPEFPTSGPALPDSVEYDHLTIGSEVWVDNLEGPTVEDAQAAGLQDHATIISQQEAEAELGQDLFKTEVGIRYDDGTVSAVAPQWVHLQPSAPVEPPSVPPLDIVPATERMDMQAELADIEKRLNDHADINGATGLDELEAALTKVDTSLVGGRRDEMSSAYENAAALFDQLSNEAGDEEEARLYTDLGDQLAERFSSLQVPKTPPDQVGYTPQDIADGNVPADVLNAPDEGPAAPFEKPTGDTGENLGGPAAEWLSTGMSMSALDEYLAGKDGPDLSEEFLSQPREGKRIVSIPSRLKKLDDAKLTAMAQDINDNADEYGNNYDTFDDMVRDLKIEASRRKIIEGFPLPAGKEAGEESSTVPDASGGTISKVDAAAKMYGVDSPQHKAAQKKFGTSEAAPAKTPKPAASATSKTGPGSVQLPGTEIWRLAPDKIKRLSDEDLVKAFQSFNNKDHSNTWGTSFKEGVANQMAKKMEAVNTELDKRGFEPLQKQNPGPGGTWKPLSLTKRGAAPAAPSGPYVPKGRTDESSFDYTDVPADLAMKFSRKQIQDAIDEAEADGSNYGTLKFDYEEQVPLQALKEALPLA